MKTLLHHSCFVSDHSAQVRQRERTDLSGGGGGNRRTTTTTHNGSRENKNGEEILPPGDWALLLAHDPRLPHKQKASRRSGHHPFQEAAEQDRGFLHASHEAHPEGSRSRHLPQAPGGGARAPHGLRPRRLRHQHRPHRSRQRNPWHASFPRNQRHPRHHTGWPCSCSTGLPLHQEVLMLMLFMETLLASDVRLCFILFSFRVLVLFIYFVSL